MDASVNFSSSAALVKRLGDELIKDPQTAFFELIKNSYDADATDVKVMFRKTNSQEGTIVIQDNGTGMSLEDLRTKWARAASENKVRQPYTQHFNRRMLGAKGIGRFSISKLGAKVKIITRTERQPDQLVFSIDFGAFTDDKNFHEMTIPYTLGIPRTGLGRGTTLEISDLYHSWGKREVKKVREQLCHLIDLERKGQDFSIRFECQDWPDLSGLLTNPISSLQSHLLRFWIERDGKYRSDFEISGKHISKRAQQKPPSYGPVEGVLRYYKEGLKSRDRCLAEGADESHMGVKVYRDGCRVRPYGELSDDWLEVKASRARGGGKYYIQTRALAGAVYISASDNSGLKDATNREAGIIESDQFLEFQAFVKEQIELLNNSLERETKSESQKQKRQTVKNVLDTIVDCLNRQESDTYRGYVERLDRGKRGKFGQSSTEKSALVSDLKVPTKEEWHCRDCDARWRVLKQGIPTVCLEFAVNRQGKPRDVNGCGSENIERATHERRGSSVDLSSVVSGQYALVEGKQVRVRVDYDMGQRENEYLVDEREILINGNHPAYTVAEKLDGMSDKKYEIGDDVFVPALTIHIAKCACLAWAELHYLETRKWEEFKQRYDSLLLSICELVRSKSS